MTVQVTLSSLETVLICRGLERLADTTDDPVCRKECRALLKKLKARQK